MTPGVVMLCIGLFVGGLLVGRYVVPVLISKFRKG